MNESKWKTFQGIREKGNRIITPFQGIRDTSNTTGFSQFFIRRGVRDGVIPHIRCGEKILVNVPAFLQLMDEQSKKGA